MPVTSRTEPSGNEPAVGKERRGLLVTTIVLTVGLALAVAFLIGAAEEYLPQIPGLDYRIVQGGLVLLTVAFGIYAVDRERQLRELERRFLDQHRESERLRTVDDMKSAIMQAVSHDLRSPLTVIVGMAQLLEGRGEELTAERLRLAAQRIGVQARRLDSMLTDVLDADRTSRGAVRLNAEELAVDEIVRATVETLDIEAHQVVFELEPFRMRADRMLLERIVDNLVGNAVKYTPEGSRITVRLEPRDDGVRLEVDDTGEGVPDHLKDVVFELFDRGHAPEGISGSGIGLSLVRRFARLHGGRAWVEDAEGGGASFRVELAPLPPEDDPGAVERQ